MKFRKVSATFVYTLSGKPLKNGIIVFDEKGIIQDIIDTNGELYETEGLEHYSGILCPGFVNAHCHLELSHLNGKIREGLNLAGFLKEINLLRNNDDDLQLKLMFKADRQMQTNGIVAVADIANNSFSLEVKEQSKIYYYTFIECFGFLPERAPSAMEYASFINSLYDSAKLPCSITAHAPYSVSEALWTLLIQNATERKSVLSIHHQESAEEDLMFVNGDGKLIDHYKDNLKLDTSCWKPTGKSSTEAILNTIPAETKILLVHNTFVDSNKMELLIRERQKENTFLVTCPKSNFYIENKLPDYELLKCSGFTICIGTDSLASNNNLSVLDEMKVIADKSPATSFEELLMWASLNGAKALGIESWAGSIDIGKKPGINLITGLDLKSLKLTATIKLKKII